MPNSIIYFEPLLVLSPTNYLPNLDLLVTTPTKALTNLQPPITNLYLESIQIVFTYLADSIFPAIFVNSPLSGSRLAVLLCLKYYFT